MTETITANTTLTIGIDLGDRKSHLCVLDASGDIVEESQLATTPKAVRARSHSGFVRDALLPGHRRTSAAHDDVGSVNATHEPDSPPPVLPLGEPGATGAAGSPGPVGDPGPTGPTGVIGQVFRVGYATRLVIQLGVARPSVTPRPRICPCSLPACSR